MLLVPFGLNQRDGKLYTVDEVEGGLNCGCVCPAPQCERPLVARQNVSRTIPHFAHYGEPDGSTVGCGAVESGLHRYAKQFLCHNDQRGKVFPMEHRESPKLYNGYEGAIKIDRAIPEHPIPRTTRRCDVLIEGRVRKMHSPSDGKKKRGEWKDRAKVAVEIYCTNPKTRGYIDEVTIAGSISVIELTLRPQDVQKYMEDRYAKGERTTWKKAIHNLILGTRNDNRKWLYRRGLGAGISRSP